MFECTVCVVHQNGLLSYPWSIPAFPHLCVHGICSCSSLHFISWLWHQYFLDSFHANALYLHNCLKPLSYSLSSFSITIFVPEDHTLFLKHPLEPRKTSYPAFFKSVRRQRESQQNLQNIFLLILSYIFSLGYIFSPLQKRGCNLFPSLF